MKQGDHVVRVHSSGRCSGQVTAVRSDPRGFWIQLAPGEEEARYANLFAETWHNAECFKVVEPEPPTRRECEFIEVNNVNAVGVPIRSIWVPRPTSFFGGWARHQWLKGYFKQECAIASPELWAVLIERHGAPKLIVEEGGEWRVE